MHLWCVRSKLKEIWVIIYYRMDMRLWRVTKAVINHPISIYTNQRLLILWNWWAAQSQHQQCNVHNTLGANTFLSRAWLMRYATPVPNSQFWPNGYEILSAPFCTWDTQVWAACCQSRSHVLKECISYRIAGTMVLLLLVQLWSLSEISSVNITSHKRV